MDNLVRQADFARIVGKSKAYINKLKRENKLIMNGDMVVVDASLKKLKLNSDPTRKNNGNNAIRSKLVNDNDNLDNNDNDSYLDENLNILEEENPSDFAQSKARKEYYLSKVAQLKFREQAKELILVADVNKQQFTYIRLLRDMIFNVSKRVSSQLISMNDFNEIKALLDREFTNVFAMAIIKAQEEIEEIEREKEEDDN